MRRKQINYILVSMKKIFTIIAMVAMGVASCDINDGSSVKPVTSQKMKKEMKVSTETSISVITRQGKEKTFLFENGDRLTQKGKTVTVFNEDGKKLFKDSKTAFLWQIASVGQKVDLTGEMPMPVGLPSITDIQRGKSVIVNYLSNGQQVWFYEREVEGSIVYLKDEDGREICWTRDENRLFSWAMSKKGQFLEVAPRMVIRGEPRGGYILIPSKSGAYRLEKHIAKVSKHDGGMSEIQGEIKGSKGLFYGTVEGKVSGSSAFSEDFFVNIWFEEGGSPISVNAKENPLWLDVEPGDIVVEQYLNGRITYSPKFINR